MRLLAPLLVASFLGCTSVGDVTDRPTGVSTALTIKGPAGTTVVMVGATATLAVQVDRTAAFDGPVVITVRDPAAGVSVSPLTIPADAADGSLVIAVDEGMTQGTIDLDVVGANPSGVTSAETTISVLVRGKPGELDTTYGAAGIGDTLPFRPARAVVDPSGKTVMVGTKDTSDTTSDFVVARLDASGSADSSFGAGGIVSLNISDSDTATAVALTPDSKILVAGSIATMAINSGRAVVLRFNADGTLDNTFGPGGRATAPLNAGYFSTIALQADGKILAGGAATPDGGQSPVEMLARFTAAGALDSTFGNDGVVTSGLDSGAAYLAYFGALLVDGSGVIVGGTYSSTSGQIVNTKAYVGRYTSNGTLDSTFGTSGTTVISSGIIGQSADFPGDLARTSDGKILALSTHSTTSGTKESRSVFIASTSSRGVRDPAFGTSGILTVDPDPTNYMSGGALTLQPDGKLLFDATTGGDAFGGAVYLARRMPDGSPDVSFGVVGVARASALGKVAYPSSILLQGDGRIVVIYSTIDRKGAATARFWN